MASRINEIRHLLNPLHIYCRLIKKGVSREEALNQVKQYEKFIYNQLIIEILTELYKIFGESKEDI